MRILKIIVLLTICNQTFAQETFPVNGVVESFEPIYAFTNAHIITGTGINFENGILLIKGNKIIAVDSSLNIPKGAIIKNLNGDYIYPSFIDLYTDYGLKKAEKEKYISKDEDRFKLIFLSVCNC